MFRLDILDADWCLGMCGSIEFRPLPAGKTYRLLHSMQDGLKLAARLPSGELSDAKRTNEDAVIALLDPAWNWKSFEIAWQAFAEGMKRQKNITPPEAATSQKE